ncbi:MAG: nitroreductase family protein [Clostridiales bacterium]|nr:nitroreductase family protein [Clostridiales bacterium]
MELTKAMRMRRSTRSYLPQQITDQQLAALLDAAYLSPTAMGRYDHLQLRVVQDPDVLNALNADFAAAIGNVDAHPTYGAPTVIFVLGSREDSEALLGANAACMVDQMSLAATDLGLGSVYLFGICNELKNSAQASALLRIPPQFRMVSALAVGVPAEPLTEREPQAERVKVIHI